MGIRYFRKLAPPTRATFADGINYAEFTQLAGSAYAYYATTNEGIQAELVRCISEGRSGVSEISDGEFTKEYLEPKKNPLNSASQPVWREEVGAGGKLRGQRSAVGAAAVESKAPAVRNPPPTNSEIEIANKLVEVAKPKQEFQPRTGKRKAKPKAE